MWAKVREECGNQQLWNIGKTIGGMWRELPHQEKSVYQAEYDREKIEYDKQMKVYHSSSAYMAYQQEKARGRRVCAHFMKQLCSSETIRKGLGKSRQGSNGNATDDWR
jgi:hypothetical protein